MLDSLGAFCSVLPYTVRICGCLALVGRPLISLSLWLDVGNNTSFYRVQAASLSEASCSFQDLMWRTAAAARVQLRALLGLTSTQIEEGAARAALGREEAAVAQIKARVVRAAVCNLSHHFLHRRIGNNRH